MESYFERLRKMAKNQHRGAAHRDLHQCAEHTAWLEDHRTTDIKGLAFRLVDAALVAPNSGKLNTYYHQVTEI